MVDNNFTIPAAKPIDPAVSEAPMVDRDDPNRVRQVVRQDEQRVDAAKEYTEMTPEERARRKALLIQAFDRGVVHDRLTVPIPKHMYGEWCRNDPLEIDRLKTLGFEVYEQENGGGRGLNSDGTGALIVADVIYMVTPRENKEIIDEIRMERFLKANGRPGDRKAKSKEEVEFEKATLRDSGGVVPTLVESSTTTRFSRADVEAALDKVDSQTQPQQVPST
jgi:hypothetical protein